MRYVLLFLFLQTYLPHSYSQEAKPIVFEKAFSGDTSYINPSLPFNFYLKTLGFIKIKSGKLIICDIEMKNVWPALSEKIPTGFFPVQIAIAKEFEDRFVAYSRILFSTAPVVKWEKASMNKNIDSLMNCQHIEDTFKVTGIGIFIDPITNKLADSKAQKKSTDAFIDKVKADDYFFGAVYNFESHSFAAFSGTVSVCFSIYIGYDEKGNICRLLADTHRISLPLSFY